MNTEFPAYNMTSVNGDYMNTGSRYAPNIEPVQEVYYSVNENRFEEDYPPIGQLVPIGDNYVVILYLLIYFLIKLIRKNIKQFSL